MRIEIKRSDVMEEIYAVSALKGYVSLPERERALLQEDQSEGLDVLVADAFAETVMELMPLVGDFSLPEDTGGDMWIELKAGCENNGPVLAAAGAVLSKSIAWMVLGAIYEASGEGAAYETKARRGIAITRETIDYGCGELPRLRGWR